MKQESEEIFKTIEKAVYQVDKYKSYVYDISDRHQKRILGDQVNGEHREVSMSPCSRTSSTGSVPKVIEFQIGEPPTLQRSLLLGTDGETVSLIDENSTLLDAYVDCYWSSSSSSSLLIDMWILFQIGIPATCDPHFGAVVACL